MKTWTGTYRTTCLKWRHITFLFLMCAVPILTYKLTTTSFLVLLCSSFSEMQVNQPTLHHNCLILLGADFRYFWAKCKNSFGAPTHGTLCTDNTDTAMKELAHKTCLTQNVKYNHDAARQTVIPLNHLCFHISSSCMFTNSVPLIQYNQRCWWYCEINHW